MAVGLGQTAADHTGQGALVNLHTAVARDRRGRLAGTRGLGHAAAHHSAVSDGHLTVHEDAAVLFHQRVCDIARIGHGLVAADDVLGLVCGIGSKFAASDGDQGVGHTGAAVTAHIVAADDLARGLAAGNRNTRIAGDDEVVVGLAFFRVQRSGILHHAAAH